MEQGRNKKLFKDILIYGAGSLGAKLITFILFPVYTFYIAPADLGYFDISLSFIFFIIPFINIELRSGVFRFLIDNHDENKRKAVISSSYNVIATMTIIASLLFAGISIITDIRCGTYILGLLIIMSFYEVQIQIVRGLGHTKLYVGCGILSSILILLFSIIFVIILRWDIEGIFLANILARLLVIGFIEIRLSVVVKYFSLKIKDKETGKALLKYCLPLILTVSFLWTISNSHRIFINHYMGLDEVGLFAAALKFAVIIEILSYIIFQAWQETSVLQLEAKDRDKYYSTVLSSYLLVLTGLVITLSFFLKTFYPIFVEAQYAGSAIYLYLLCVAGIGDALMAFMTALFQAKKNTMKMLQITILTSITSIALHFLLIKYSGLMGAAIAYALSYLLMFVYYFIAARKNFKIIFSVQSLIISAVLIIGGGLIFHMTDNVFWKISYWTICMAVIYLTLPKSMVLKTINWITDKLSILRKT